MTLSFAFVCLRRLLAFAMLSASLSATAAAQASTPQPTAPEPAAGKGLPMWVIHDDDSTIYITGTIHILKDGTNWRSDRLDAAFASASELWLEVAEIGDPDGIQAAVLPIVEKYAQWDGTKLSSLLTTDEGEKLAEAFRIAGTPPDIIAKTEELQPWFTNYALSRTPFTSGPFDPANGIDNALGRMAFALGHEVKGLEEVDDQIRLMLGHAVEAQLASLRELIMTPITMNAGKERISELTFSSWARGETNMVEAMMAFALMSSDRSFTDTIFKKRNQNWAARIEKILEGSGVAFIAVGAGHLIGPDSLQVQLKKRGIETERY